MEFHHPAPGGAVLERRHLRYYRAKEAAQTPSLTFINHVQRGTAAFVLRSRRGNEAHFSLFHPNLSRAVAERLRRANALVAEFMEGRRAFIPALADERFASKKT